MDNNRIGTITFEKLIIISVTSKIAPKKIMQKVAQEYKWDSEYELLQIQ